MKDIRRKAGWLGIAAVLISAFFMTGCQNPFSQEDRLVTGSLDLSVGSPVGRTIAPTWPAADVTFALTITNRAGGDPLTPEWTSGSGSIELIPGTYDILIRAYLDTVLVATGASDPETGVVISPQGTTAVNIALEPVITDAGTGTLTWDITFPAGEFEAELTVTTLASLPLDPPVAVSVPNVESPFASSAGTQIVLPSGTYYVVLTLSGGAGDLTVTEVLHVFDGLTSHFAANFPATSFPRSLFGEMARTWDSGSADFVGLDIQAGHFAILNPPVLGVTGGDDGNFGAILINLADLIGGDDFPASPAELGTLVDIALLRIASDTDSFLNLSVNTALNDRAAVMIAIRETVAVNGTAIPDGAFVWANDSDDLHNNTLTLTVPGFPPITFPFVNPGQLAAPTNVNVTGAPTAPLAVGQMVSLTAESYPEPGHAVEWEFIDGSEARAEFESRGATSAVVGVTGAGEVRVVARIAAAAFNNVVSEPVVIEVRPAAASVTIDPSGPIGTLDVGAMQQLTATVQPDSALFDGPVTWGTSDPEVATVSADGLVTIEGRGTVTITATAENFVGADVYGTVVINVPVFVTGITIDTVAPINLAVAGIGGDVSAVVAATILPADATNMAVTWTTTDASIARVAPIARPATADPADWPVNEVRATVTAAGQGPATITVAAVDGGHDDTVEVSVVSNLGPTVIPATWNFNAPQPPAGWSVVAATGNNNTPLNTADVQHTNNMFLHGSRLANGMVWAPAASQGLALPGVPVGRIHIAGPVEGEPFLSIFDVQGPFVFEVVYSGTGNEQVPRYVILYINGAEEGRFVTPPGGAANTANAGQSWRRGTFEFTENESVSIQIGATDNVRIHEISLELLVDLDGDGITLEWGTLQDALDGAIVAGHTVNFLADTWGTIEITGLPAGVNPATDIRWYHGANRIGTGAVLDLDDTPLRDFLGTQFITVVVMVDGVPFSRRISLTVNP